MRRGRHITISEFTMKVTVWIWNQLTWKPLILLKRIQPPVFGVQFVSHQIFACSFTSMELLSRQGKNYNLFVLYSIQLPKVSVKIFSMLKLLVKSIVSSKLPIVFLNKYTRMILEQFLKWFWKYRAAFPTIYCTCCWARAMQEFRQPHAKQSSSEWWGYSHVTPRRCMTHDRKCQLVLLDFEKYGTPAVANEDTISKFSTKTRRLYV